MRGRYYQRRPAGWQGALLGLIRGATLAGQGYVAARQQDRERERERDYLERQDALQREQRADRDQHELANAVESMAERDPTNASQYREQAIRYRRGDQVYMPPSPRYRAPGHQQALDQSISATWKGLEAVGAVTGPPPQLNRSLVPGITPGPTPEKLAEEARNRALVRDARSDYLRSLPVTHPQNRVNIPEALGEVAADRWPSLTREQLGPTAEELAQQRRDRLTLRNSRAALVGAVMRHRAQNDPAFASTFGPLAGEDLDADTLVELLRSNIGRLPGLDFEGALRWVEDPQAAAPGWVRGPDGRSAGAGRPAVEGEAELIRRLQGQLDGPGGRLGRAMAPGSPPTARGGALHIGMTPGAGATAPATRRGGSPLPARPVPGPRAANTSGGFSPHLKRRRVEVREQFQTQNGRAPTAAEANELYRLVELGKL